MADGASIRHHREKILKDLHGLISGGIAPVPMGGSAP